MADVLMAADESGNFDFSRNDGATRYLILCTVTAMSYAGVHKGVRRRRGRASEWGCAFCAVPAKEWAYTHDPLDGMGEP
jgi:hypothetical protein